MDYNKIAKKYDIYGKQAITDWVLGYNNVLKFLLPLNNKSVLDYGCGVGKFSRFIRDSGAKIIAVDPSIKMIELAEQHDSANIKYHYIKAPELNFIQPSSLDAAVLNFVLCTVSSKDEIRAILKAINRVLKTDSPLVILNVNWDKSNGKKFISFELERAKNLKSGQKVNVVLKSKKPLKVKDCYWSRDDYIGMLAETGIKIDSIHEPLAKDEEHPWLDEKNYPPFLIIVATKQN